MGLFDSILNRLRGRTISGSYTFQGSSPPWSGSIWEHDICRATIDAIATAVASGTFIHVVVDENEKIKEVKHSSPYAKVLNERPNDVMTAWDLKYRLAAQLETKTTAILYVTWKTVGHLVVPDQVIPVDYSSYSFAKTATGTLAVEIRPTEGGVFYLLAEDCVILRKFYQNRLGGGDGNRPLYQVLGMSKASDEGFIESLQVANKVRGIHKHKVASLKDEDVEKDQEAFAKRFAHAAKNGGALSIDSKEEYLPINVTSYSANAAQMNLISERIYTYFRTPKEIVMGTASEEVRMNWYESKIKPIWEALECSLNSMMFTQRERDNGNRILINGGGVKAASLDTKLNFIKETFGMGIYTQNFYLDLMGQPPREDGDVAYLNLTYAKTTDVTEYQLGHGEETPKGGEEDEQENA